MKNEYGRFNSINMRYALCRAWSEAKKAIAKPLTAVDRIRDAIWMLENKNRWTQADYARHGALYQELRAA